ncbi:MAG: beta-galactosidase trimerization domain-containing protein [Bacteroidetes bacterium]|nr:beta-galactosidase trimerization domain-containing protein [Bacteroidota bacterium]
MNRRQFILAGLGAPAITLGPAAWSQTAATDQPWTSRMRWAQLAFVENDPKRYDPDLWLDYFRLIHADGALLSAGGVVAFYPTNIPFHHRSDWLGNSDPVGYMIKGCRKMNMSVVLRTDPHATRQDMFDAHPDYISVTADGKPRRHWANPELWVTCAYGPYNLVFMTDVHREIMERYQPDGIFSNRWAGHGICYCRHCTENFKKATGLDLPRSERRLDPVYQKWEAWRKDRLREVWFTWDGEIRKHRAGSRFIPNGFPDKLETGKYADFFFADQQARRGIIPPWSNAMGAKELRAGLGMKPIVNIFSVGVEEEYRWKDSVQSDAEIRIWVAEGVAAGMRPCFVKFGAYIYDKRWMKAVEKMYDAYHRNEAYLNNTAPLARIGLVYSEQTNQKYGGKPWQEKSNEHALGIYQALVEDHLPFEMVNDKLLDAGHLNGFKLLILPNIAALSDSQCRQLKDFVAAGGSLVATFETSLYDQDGRPRDDFGLSGLLGVSVDPATASGTGGQTDPVEGPMRNSYLRIKSDHQVVQGLEDSYKIINSVYRVKVKPNVSFPDPVTLIPTYPDLPMEDVYPRQEETGVRELYLREPAATPAGSNQARGGRVAYFPGDLDRSFWQMLSTDHSRLLRNTIRWALEEPPIVILETKGVIDVAVWAQKNSMTVHLVNLTNPMYMKGPFRDILPVDAGVRIHIPTDKKLAAVHLLMSGVTPEVRHEGSVISLDIKQIEDHEVIALDWA